MGLFLLSESKDVHEVEYHPNVDEVEVEAQLRTQRLSQYKELTFAFYTFNSNYWISWECAELLIRLSSSGVSFRLCVTFTFLFRYRSDSRSFHAFARTLFHTRYPHHSYLLRLFPYHMISMWYSLFRSSIPLSEYNYILPVFMPFSCVPSGRLPATTIAFRHTLLAQSSLVATIGILIFCLEPPTHDQQENRCGLHRQNHCLRVIDHRSLPSFATSVVEETCQGDPLYLLLNYGG